MSVRVELIAPTGARQPTELIDELRSFAAPTMTVHDWGTSIRFVGDPAAADALRPIVRARACEAGWDAAVITGRLATQPPALLVMDVDSTLITAEVIDLLADAAGSGDEVAEITDRAMRGEVDFGSALRERVATLEGLPVGVFSEVVDQIEFTPGARQLISAARSQGTRIGLVSGGFIEVVQHLAAEVGTDYAVANHLEIVDGHLTGRTTGEIIDRDAKLRHLQGFAELAGCTLERAVAIGDGANDLAMLAGAGLGIAYCAKPVAANAAPATISFPRLDAARALAGI